MEIPVKWTIRKFVSASGAIKPSVVPVLSIGESFLTLSLNDKTLGFDIFHRPKGAVFETWIEAQNEKLRLMEESLRDKRQEVYSMEAELATAMFEKEPKII